MNRVHAELATLVILSSPSFIKPFLVVSYLKTLSKKEITLSKSWKGMAHHLSAESRYSFFLPWAALSLRNKLLKVVVRSFQVDVVNSACLASNTLYDLALEDL